MAVLKYDPMSNLDGFMYHYCCSWALKMWQQISDKFTWWGFLLIELLHMCLHDLISFRKHTTSKYKGFLHHFKCTYATLHTHHVLKATAFFLRWTHSLLHKIGTYFLNDLYIHEPHPCIVIMMEINIASANTLLISTAK